MRDKSSYFLTVGEDNKVEIRNLQTLQSCTEVITDEATAFYDCFPLADGLSLACSGYVYPNHVLVYDLPSRKLKGRCIGHMSFVYRIAEILDESYAPTRHFATVGQDGTIRLWDYFTFKQVSSFEALTSVSLVYLMHPRWIASGFYEGITNVWDVETGEVMAQLADGTEERRKGSGGIVCLESAIYNERTLLGSANTSGMVAFWDLREDVRTGGAPLSPLPRTSQSGEGVSSGPFRKRCMGIDYYKSYGENVPARALKMVPDKDLVMIVTHEGVVRFHDLRKIESQVSLLQLVPKGRDSVTVCVMRVDDRSFVSSHHAYGLFRWTIDGKLLQSHRDQTGMSLKGCSRLLSTPEFERVYDVQGVCWRSGQETERIQFLSLLCLGAEEQSRRLLDLTVTVLLGEESRGLVLTSTLSTRKSLLIL